MKSSNKISFLLALSKRFTNSSAIFLEMLYPNDISAVWSSSELMQPDLSVSNLLKHLCQSMTYLKFWKTNYLSSRVGIKHPGSSLILKNLLKMWTKKSWKHSGSSLQLNLHETDLSFQFLSHHLTWHCLLIYGFSPVFPSSCLLWW